jgi:hypothetical protein
MTVNLLHRKKRGSATPDSKPTTTPIAIGDMGARVSYCASCGSPVSDGTWRCPVCGGKLVFGVAARRGLAILAVGIVIGILSGGVITALAISAAPSGKPAEAAVVATAAPVVTAIPTAAAVAIAAPQAAVTALSGTALVNGRISADTATMVATLADPKAATMDVVSSLRVLSADAALGVDQAARLATWHEADSVRGQLDDFYQSMSKTANLAFGTSLDDASEYRRWANEMLAVLRGLSAVDAGSRTLAATVGLELPPVALPASR